MLDSQMSVLADRCLSCNQHFTEDWSKPVFLPCGDDLCLECLCSILLEGASELSSKELSRVLVSNEPQDQPQIRCPNCGLIFIISQRFVAQISKVAKKVEKRIRRRARREETISIPLVQERWSQESILKFDFPPGVQICEEAQQKQSGDEAMICVDLRDLQPEGVYEYEDTNTSHT